MRTLLFIAILLWSLPAGAQVRQSARYEREHKSSDHEFIVISMGEKGLTLVRDTEKFEQRKKAWEIIVLDSLLHETWEVKVNIDGIYSILGHDYREGELCLVFRESNNPRGKLNLLEVDLRTHNFREHEFKPEADISFTHFSIMNKVALFGGYVAKEPTILLYDMQAESAKILPGTFAPGLELLDLRTNVNSSFNALLAERKSKHEKRLILRSYDSNGVVLVDDEIKIDDDKSILTGITSTLQNDEMILIGTWGEGSNANQASGIFTVIVDPFKDQPINYYDFTGLKHYLDYLPDKKVERLRTKAEYRRSVGKPIDFRAHVASIKMEEHKNGFSFLSEVYMPANNYNSSRWGASPYAYGSPYASPYYNPYSMGPYGFGPMPSRYYSPFYGPTPYGSSTPSISETRIQHSTVLFFDLKGKLVDDLGLKYEEVKLITREQVADYFTRNGVTTFACFSGKEIQLQQTSADGSVILNQKIPVETPNPNEEVRSESNTSMVRGWFKNHFYVFGYHSVRNKGEHKSKDVFYINRVTID